FMGGDQCLVRVDTSVRNGRRLVILKDSYGNAVPSFLFGSFEQVHVIDFRYFTRNIVDYVRDNGITDMLFVHNIFNVCGSAASSAYRRFLRQKSSGVSAPVVAPVKSDPVPVDTVAAVIERPDTVMPAEPDTIVPDTTLPQDSLKVNDNNQSYQHTS
ncbi:MAG: hypothetical protein K2L69_01420, partial [Muribaculaceae bacterium]|nr:hypothetical protein [Muribaculaceae bacterium]